MWSINVNANESGAKMNFAAVFRFFYKNINNTAKLQKLTLIVKKLNQSDPQLFLLEEEKDTYYIKPKYGDKKVQSLV